MSLTKNIIAFLNFSDETYDGGISTLFFHQDFEYLGKYYTDESAEAVLAKVKELNLAIVLVEQVGGEGQGEDYWTVYSFTDTVTNERALVKFDGWYASYVGSEYSDYKFVTPQAVTRIEYL